MATSLDSVVLFLAFIIIPSTYPAPIPSPPPLDHDLLVATEEMQRANYFTFVMLLNMANLDTRLHGNLTFLMPNDRNLSKVLIPEHSVPEFLFRHSIPSPMLFDHLQRIPTGSIIPSSLPGYMLRINNGGRRSFFLNNVHILSINICTAGSSIRCHGIDGVLSPSPPSMPMNDSTASPSTCPSGSAPPLSVASPPSPSLPPLVAPPSDDTNGASQKSESSSPGFSHGFLPKCTTTCIIMLVIWVSFNKY